MRRKLSLAILAPAALVVSAEGAARLLHDPTPLRRVWDPFSYRIPHPGLRDSFEVGDGSIVEVRLNELGMRGPSAAELPAPEALTLVFLGGSTTENYSHPLDDTFPVLIGAHLEGRLGRPVRVFNAGMSAATTSVSLGRLQHQILDLHPDLLIVMHGVNDLIGGFHPGFRTDGRHLPQPPGITQKPRSYLVGWLRSQRSPPELGRQPRQEIHLEGFDDFQALRVFRRNLRSMAAITSAHSIPALFLTQAHLYSTHSAPADRHRFRLVRSIAAVGGDLPDIATLSRGMAAFNRAVLDLAEVRPNVRVFDLAGRLPRDRRLFVDEVHLTKAGNRRVAEILWPIVQGSVAP